MVEIDKQKGQASLTVPRKVFYLGVFLLGIIVGTVGLAMLRDNKPTAGPALASIGARQAGSDEKPNFYGLYSRVHEYFMQKNAPHSYYFEYLNTGTSVTADPDNLGRSFSLLKLLYVMDLYRLAEQKRIDLDETVSIQPEWLDSTYGNLWKRGAGAKISLREAARLALVESDNTALNIVKHYDLQKNTMPESIMAATGTFPALQNGKDYISSRAYSTYLRCLYFSCYLNQQNSSLLLDQMSNTTFKGITEGVPGKVRVAHKIGESAESYADCGIVYYPGHPYILCVMIQLPPPQSQPMISEISKITYAEVSRALGPK